ncbi:MAG TPA: tripartite tricarboxylate transporter substrate binding protein [Xanthobacteraceae bacterium]|nr:tripartite tricarboxylate transporter substrate binding protein [Xanthobacteraceae bacterium]
MRMPRRQFLQLAAGAAALPAAARSALADAYPSRPVRIMVGFPPGAATDIVGRLMAQSLSERLGQQFFVENRPGAGSNLAAEVVAKSAPDGYTLLAMTVTNAVNQTLYTNLDFDFMHDITPIDRTILSANVLVVNLSVPAKTVPEFITYAKANPGKLNYASYGFGTAPNMAAELFNMMVGTKLVHVPYHTNFTPDLLSGQVQLAFLPVPLIIGFIRSEKVRALAVTSATPSQALPGIPTIGQFVPGYQADIWHGIAAPKGTPPDIVDKLHQTINAILTDPAMKPKFENLGAEPAPMSIPDLNKFIAAEVDKWAKVIKFANIKAG